ncbi:MAG: biotin transporter BioY [Brevinematia bacterium]
MLTTFVENYSKIRYRFFEWRSGAVLWEKILLSFGGALLIGALAQLKIYLSWTPVPIVGSTLGVVFTAVLLGKNWGGISTTIYVLLGVLGVPWFAGFSKGVGVIAGPTGGYLIGFVLAAFFTGYIVDKSPKARKFLPLTFIMLFSHFVIIYLPGLIQLGIWLTFVKGKPFNLTELLFMGAIPFIPGDALKSIIAAMMVDIITPKRDYSR